MSNAIRTVGVAGAGGTMGAGIAIVAARAGFRTVAYDLAPEPLGRARRQTEGFCARTDRRSEVSL